MVRWASQAASLSSTEARHSGQYIQSAGAGTQLGPFCHLGNSFALIARPVYD